MAQHTYDEESVQELLGWAKKMIETKNYPTEKYQVNACTSIIFWGNLKLRLFLLTFPLFPIFPQLLNGRMKSRIFPVFGNHRN